MPSQKAKKFVRQYVPALAGAGALGLASAYPIADLIWDNPNWKQRLLAGLVGAAGGGLSAKLIADSIYDKPRDVGDQAADIYNGIRKQWDGKPIDMDNTQEWIGSGLVRPVDSAGKINTGLAGITTHAIQKGVSRDQIKELQRAAQYGQYSDDPAVKAKTAAAVSKLQEGANQIQGLSRFVGTLRNKQFQQGSINYGLSGGGLSLAFGNPMPLVAAPVAQASVNAFAKSYDPAKTGSWWNATKGTLGGQYNPFTRKQITTPNRKAYAKNGIILLAQLLGGATGRVIWGNTRKEVKHSSEKSK